MLPLDLTGIRGENLLFPSWPGYAENNSDTYSSPSLAANCMLSSLLSTNLPLQNSSSSCSHKAGFKGRGAPMLQFSPTFTRMFWLDASSCPSFTESCGSPSYRKSTETSTGCQQDQAFMLFFFSWTGGLFVSLTNPDLYHSMFFKKQTAKSQCKAARSL